MTTDTSQIGNRAWSFALDSGDARAKRVAIVGANRLVERGHLELRELVGGTRDSVSSQE
jgi:hypothetical protein